MRFTHFVHYVVPVLVPSMMLAQVGCSAPPSGGASSPSQSESTQSATQSAKLDGETIMRGVFFGQGVVAARLPETWNHARGSAPSGAVSNEDVMGALAEQAARMSAEGNTSGAASLTDLRDRIADGRLDPATISASEDFTGLLPAARVDAVIAAIRSADPAFFDKFAADMQSANPVKVQAAFDAASKRVIDASASLHLTSGTQPGDPRGDCVAIAIAVVLVAWVAIAIGIYIGKRIAPDGLEKDEYVMQLAERLAAT